MQSCWRRSLVVGVATSLAASAAVSGQTPAHDTAARASAVVSTRTLDAATTKMVRAFLGASGSTLPTQYFTCVENASMKAAAALKTAGSASGTPVTQVASTGTPPPPAPPLSLRDPFVAGGPSPWVAVRTASQQPPPAALVALADLWKTAPRAWREKRVCLQEGPGFLSSVIEAASSAASAGVLSKEIDQFATRLITKLDERVFLAAVAPHPNATSLLREAGPNNRDVFEAELLEDVEFFGNFRYMRASAFMLRGQVALKELRWADASAAFNVAHRLSPRAIVPLMELGALTAREKDTAAALPWYALARLASQSPVVNDKFKESYRAVHHGSLDGTEAYLDSVYRFDAYYSNPVNGARYPASAPRPQRRVLAQLITWVLCGRCAVRDLAVEGLVRRYDPGTVVVLAYHYAAPYMAPGFVTFNDSGPDMISDYYVKRLTKFGCGEVFLNGKCSEGSTTGFVSGWLGAPRMYTQLTPVVDKMIAARPPLELQQRVTAHSLTTQSGTIDVQVTTPALPATGHRYKVHTVLAEDDMAYTGQGGIRLQRFVVRSMAGDSASGFGIVAAAGAPVNVTQTFDLAKLVTQLRLKNPEMFGDSDMPKDAYTFKLPALSVVSYVQDDVTGEVLDVMATPVS